MTFSVVFVCYPPDIMNSMQKSNIQIYLLFHLRLSASICVKPAHDCDTTRPEKPPGRYRI